MFNNERENYLIFTDLDGTLLDHTTYSTENATEMLDFIREHNIPLIIITSKTKEEVLELRKTLNLDFPFIVENGAGIFIPNVNGFKQITMGKTHLEALSFLNTYKKQFNIKSFSDMSTQEVSSLTGLDDKHSALAKKRDFCEPFIIEDKLLIPKIQKIALENGFDIVEGGRFYHLISQGQDKSTAMLELQKVYEKKFNKKYTTIALGDGGNDKTMLLSSDISILIKKYDGSFIDIEKDGLIKTNLIGPAGWNQSLKDILCK